MSDSVPMPGTLVLHCMDLWSGSQSVEHTATTPGVELYVFSRPYQGAREGGDVHYVSLCAGGIVTRILLADVSGHGAAVAETARELRSLMRRFMNSKRQDRLVQNLNREFTRIAQNGRFATAIVATYLSHRRQLTLCNAGHPRPLRYRKAAGAWEFLKPDDEAPDEISNLPLGLDDSGTYRQSTFDVRHGDALMLYTDALIESDQGDGRLLGEEGLLSVVASQPLENVQTFGAAVMRSLFPESARKTADDDATIIVLRFSDAARRRPSVREKLTAYARMLHLQPVDS